MRDENSHERDVRDRNHRRRGHRPPQKRSYLLPILAGVAACLFVCCSISAIVGYFMFGIKTETDPHQVDAARERHADLDLPPELAPQSHQTELAGGETITYASPSGRSFFQLKPVHSLSMRGTVRESHEQGQRAGGGRPEEPAEKKTIRSEVRGQPAEFEYRRYANYERVKGYFQGKVQPVAVEAEFDFREFPAGTAEKVVGAIR